MKRIARGVAAVAGLALLAGACSTGGDTTDPASSTGEESSPSGIAFVDSADGAALYVGALRGQRLWRIPIGAESPGGPEPMLLDDFGRLRTA